MTTAVTGLMSQSQALGNLSDNIANSQTTGFKRIETSFQTLVTESNASTHAPGGVRAKPRYTNDQQGTITQSENPTHIALSGNGFFQVSRGVDGVSDVSFGTSPVFTRAGNFELDRYGYLRNSSNLFLNGWGIDSGGSVVRGNLAPIRIQQLIDNPTATQNITLSANLPMTPPLNSPLPAQEVSTVDANGVERKVQLNWRQQSQDNWRLSFTVPDSAMEPTGGTLTGINDQSLGTPLVAMPGVTPVPQVSLATISTVTSGTAYSLSVNGKSYAYTAQSFDTPNTVAAQLFSQVNGSGNAPGTVTISGNTITLAGNTTGSAFTISSSGTSLNTAPATATVTAPTAALAQVSTATIGPVNVGSVYSLVVGGTSYTYTALASDNASSVAQQLAAAAAVDPALASCTSSGGVITMTGSAVNTAFTLTTTPAAGTTASIMSTMTATGTGTAATVTSAAAGVNQQSTLTIGTAAGAAVSPGTTFATSIDGTIFTYISAAGDTTDTVATNLAGVVTASGLATVTVTANTPATNSITFDAATANTPFILKGSPTPVQGVQEQMFMNVTGTAGDIGDVYTINFGAIVGPPSYNATSVSYTTDGTEANLNTIVQRLASQINSNANAPITAEVNGAGLKMTAKVASSTSILAAISGTTINGTMPPHLDVAFGDGGYLQSIKSTNIGSGNATASLSQQSGDPAYVEFQVDYGQGPQTIRLNVGKFGQSTGGLTQFAGTAIDTFAKTQDGFTRGAFRNIKVEASGDVIANYDNGRARVLARIPVIQVDNANAMDMVDGDAFVQTRASGGLRADDPGANGAASLVTSSLEGSNVDIAQEFTKLIVTQRAYSANTKMVTASDEILQETLGMKR
jgi:flagellar hook protein FlgE